MVKTDKIHLLMLPEHVFLKFDHVFVAKMFKKMMSRLFILTVLCLRSVLAGEGISLAASRSRGLFFRRKF